MLFRSMMAHAGLQITLINPNRTPSQVLLQQSIAGQARMPTDSPQGVAEGLQAALADALGKVQGAISPFA